MARDPYTYDVSLQEAPASGPEYLQRMNEFTAKRQMALSARPYEGFRLAPHERIAAFSPDIIEARRLGREGQGAYRPYLQRSERQLQQAAGAFPEHAERYMNPYMRHVVNRIGEEGERTFKERIMPHLSAQFAGLGQHGSTRHAQMASRAARDLQNEIMAKQQQAMASGYQQAGQFFNADQARALEAAHQQAALGTLQQAGQQGDITDRLRMGLIEQKRLQDIIDEQQREDLAEREYPQEQLNNLVAVLNGRHPGGSSTQTITANRNAVEPGVLQGLAGLAGNGLAAALMRARGGYIQRRARGGYIRRRF
jgi:hypothetical protein